MGAKFDISCQPGSLMSVIVISTVRSSIFFRPEIESAVPAWYSAAPAMRRICSAPGSARLGSPSRL